MKQITILKQVWLTLCLLRSYLCLSLGISCLPVKTKMKWNQNYSSYVELNFPFTVKGVDLNATCGVLPYDAGITTYGGDVNSGFAVTNVALKATKDIKITDSFSLPIFDTGNLEPSHGGCPSCLGNFFKTLI